MVVMLWVFALFFTIYLVWVTWMRFIWKRRDAPVTKTIPTYGISLVIPFRNEASNLPILIDCLENQCAARENFEVIFVNDNSDDGGEKLISTSMTHKILDLKNDHGKKAAIRNGIQHARHDWIITLDADVILGPFWLTSVSNAINSLECDMIILPLMLHEGKSAFDKMQCIEFMSLLGTTAAMAIAGRPILCNGANLAFRKSAWDKANQMRIDDDISSGDDMFLLHALKKTGKVKWLHSTDAMAYTSPVSTLSEFISQRVRWTSKSLRYRDMETTLTAILVAVINIALVIFFVFGLEYRACMNLFLVTMLVKTSFDLLLIVRVAEWTGKQGLFVYAIVVSILYPFYALMIPLAAIFYRPKWKGRTISLRPSKKSVREE